METPSSNHLRSYSKSAHESHLDLLSRGTLSDVTFIVGPSKERIPGHQAFLVARSPVFEVMFSARWNQDKNKEVPLEDIDPKIFRMFLQFIYADAIVANVPETLGLLQVAEFYDVQLLVSKCEELLLEKEVTLNDAVDIFQAAQKYGKIQLMDKAGDFMAKSLFELQSHPSFSRMHKETLVYILKRNSLDMEEVDLFRLAVRWAKNQCEGLALEQSLEDILPLIRFPVMTLEEFTTTVVPTGLLSQSTLLEVLTYFGTDDETKKSLASTLKFNTESRRSVNYYDLYSGDLAKKETRHLQLEKLEESLILITLDTGTTAMGISGISVYCPARVASSASSPVSSTFKEFRIILQSVTIMHLYLKAVRRNTLLDMSPVKVEEGKITKIKFDTVVPLANKSQYRIIVEEIPRSSRQRAVAVSTKAFYVIKDFGRIRNRGLSLSIVNEAVVVGSIQLTAVQENSDLDNDCFQQPQLICRLGLEKL